MSLYADILRDVQSEIRNLNLVPAVYRRKSPRVAESDLKPCILVTPEAELEESLHGPDTVRFMYPVVVTIVQAGNGDLEAGVDDALDWREAIRKHFHKPDPLPNVESIFDGEVSLTDPFDRLLIPADYDASQIRLYFLSEEIRDDS